MSEHKINAKRYIWNRSDGERFEFIEKIEQDMCELSKKHLAVIDSSEIDSDNKLEKVDIFVCFIENSLQIDYDYDYEDNLTEDYSETTNYIPIKFCPFCGSAFVINIIEEIDMSEELNPFWDEYYSLNKERSSKTKRQKQNDLYQKMFGRKYKWILIDK